jgi:hypothetical protein
MDLFVMNRYWSEDQIEQPEQTNEEKLLEKLKAKVASKKKSQKDVGSEPKSKKVKLESKDNETDVVIEKKVKAGKKPKPTDESVTEEASVKTENKVPSEEPEIKDRFVDYIQSYIDFIHLNLKDFAIIWFETKLCI